MDREWINDQTGNTKSGLGTGAFVKDFIPLSTAAFQHLNESTNIIECLLLSITKHNLRKENYNRNTLQTTWLKHVTVLQQTRRKS